LLLIIFYQFAGLGEKLWLRQWGKAYDKPTHHIASYDISSNAVDHYHLSQLFGTVGQGIHLDAPPSAKHAPFFYVGVYAAIGYGAAVVATINTSIQASRVFVLSSQYLTDNQQLTVCGILPCLANSICQAAQDVSHYPIS